MRQSNEEGHEELVLVPDLTDVLVAEGDVAT
jgi:hypothetical protein